MVNDPNDWWTPDPDDLEEDEFAAKIPARYQGVVKQTAFEKFSRSDEWW